MVEMREKRAEREAAKAAKAAEGNGAKDGSDLAKAADGDGKADAAKIAGAASATRTRPTRAKRAATRQASCQELVQRRLFQRLATSD